MEIRARFNDRDDVADTGMRCFPETPMDLSCASARCPSIGTTTTGGWTTMGRRYDDDLYRLDDENV